MTGTEPQITNAARRSSAQVDVMRSGTHIITVDALYVTVLPNRHGLSASLHLTREQARDIHAALDAVFEEEAIG